MFTMEKEFCVDSSDFSQIYTVFLLISAEIWGQQSCQTQLQDQVVTIGPPY